MNPEPLAVVVLVSARVIAPQKASERSSEITHAECATRVSFTAARRNGRGRLINNNLSTRAPARPCSPAPCVPPAFH